MDRMNVYDFDKTIYKADSTLDFYLFSLKRYPFIIRYLPIQTAWVLKYKAKACSKEEMKEHFFVFLKDIQKMESHLERFWDIHEKKIQSWYLNQKKEDDLIISASPDFLLEPIMKRCKIRHWLATEVNRHTGYFQTPNCYGEEKVTRLRQRYPQAVIHEFYSDSRTDTPLANLADKAYLVTKGKRIEWTL